MPNLLSKAQSFASAVVRRFSTNVPNHVPSVNTASSNAFTQKAISNSDAERQAQYALADNERNDLKDQFAMHHANKILQEAIDRQNNQYSNHSNGIE